MENNKNVEVDISSNLKEMEFYEDCIQTDEEYLLDTFLDPIDVFEFRAANEQRRNKVSFRDYMMFFVEIPICQIPQQRIAQ